MKRGFTLVEMVLVLVIVSILAQLTNVTMKARREAAIVDVLNEYIQIFVSAMRMYYYNNNGNFPSDFDPNKEVKTIPSLKPYLPRSFSRFEAIVNCKVKPYVKEKEEQSSEEGETSNSQELAGYGIVVNGINDKKILEKLKDQLLLEVNMKDANTETSREELKKLIQINPSTGEFIFYLKTDNKSYL